jgi:NAD+ synthase
MDLQVTVREIISFLQENVKNLNRKGAVIGLSGGLDSTVCAYLCVEALGRDKVFAIFMPDRDSHPQSEKDAVLVSQILGIKLMKINLTPILRKIGIYNLEPLPLLYPLIPRRIKEIYTIKRYDKLRGDEETTFLRTLKGGDDFKLRKDVAYYSSKHRLRMTLLYYWAEIKNYAVIGCCNKTEKLTGFFIKYGDSASDIEPISQLYKTQVKEIANLLKVPQNIINKPPSPDIVPGITDEFALKLSYEIIDKILYGIERGLNDKDISDEMSVDESKIKYVRELIKLSKHMRELPISFGYAN